VSKPVGRTAHRVHGTGDNRQFRGGLALDTPDDLNARSDPAYGVELEGGQFEDTAVERNEPRNLTPISLCSTGTRGGRIRRSKQQCSEDV
jgi:hypothetical protein